MYMIISEHLYIYTFIAPFHIIYISIFKFSIFWKYKYYILYLRKYAYTIQFMVYSFWIIHLKLKICWKIQQICTSINMIFVLWPSFLHSISLSLSLSVSFIWFLMSYLRYSHASFTFIRIIYLHHLCSIVSNCIE